MASPSSFSNSLLHLSFFILLAQALVPSKNTFKYVNEGDFNMYPAEYGAEFRSVPVGHSPFYLCFYRTTSNAYTLGIQMGTSASGEWGMWVWEANRGNPVGEKATLTFGRDGNLILKNADGRLVWQTGTANKGVVGVKMLPNGNMVLYDSKGKFMWQSFDFATDTLLIGQMLKVGGPTKLVSRASDKISADGPYSLALEDKRWGLYYQSPNHPKPLLYYADDFIRKKGLKAMKLDLFSMEGASMEVTLEYEGATTADGYTSVLTKVKYNATYSFLRLGQDGNLRIYTFDDKVVTYGAWDETYTLFNRKPHEMGDCQLPERCGNFGLCEDSQCVACPSERGLLGWSKRCEAKKLSGCGLKDFRYYKLLGVDHFTCKYEKGVKITEQECFKKCTRNCKCLGYFYNKDKSKCWFGYDLKTLTRVGNSTHVAYIKVPRH